MINKGINLYCDYEPYYGINLHYWVVEKEKGQTKESFIEDLKKAYKEENYLQKVMDAGDLFDFLDTLKNGLNGDDLYNNVVENLVYLEEFRNELYKKGICDEFDEIALPNLHDYDESEALSIFGLLTPYLNNNDKFKNWLFDKIRQKDDVLYTIITNPEEGNKQRIKYIKSMIEKRKDWISSCENTIKNREKEIIGYKREIIDFEKEIKTLEGGSNEQ